MTIEVPNPLAPQAFALWLRWAQRAEHLLELQPNTRGKVDVDGREYTTPQAIAAAGVYAQLADSAAKVARALQAVEGRLS